MHIFNETSRWITRSYAASGPSKRYRPGNADGWKNLKRETNNSLILLLKSQHNPRPQLMPVPSIITAGDLVLRPS
jgi:hypothetical protein